MKVVICGAGQVGRSLIRCLHRDYDVVIIDTCMVTLDKSQKKYDIQSIHGNAADPCILQRADITPETIVIAVTGDDQINITACCMAKTLFSAQWTSARLRLGGYLMEKWEESLKKIFHIDLFLSPEKDVTQSILKSFKIRHAFDILSLTHGPLQLIGIQIHPDSPLIHHTLQGIYDVFQQYSVRIVHIIRNYHSFIPTLQERICLHDAIYFIAASHDILPLMKAWGYPQDKTNRVIVIGATLTSHYLLKQLSDLSIEDLVVIDEDDEQLKAIASHYPNALLLRGNPLNPELLAEANISNTGYTIALTPDDTLNILASLMARSYGVCHPIALVQRTDSLSSLFTLGIEKMIHPSQLIIARLLQKLTQTYVNLFYPLEGDRSGTFIEVIIQEKTPAIGLLWSAIQDETLSLIAVIRQKKTIWEETPLQAEDHVLLIVLAEGYAHFQRLFEPE